MTQMITPGSVIGIVGGGQLGRMLALEAAAMGYKTHIFTPERDAPASHVSTLTTIGAYQDTNALRDFGSRVSVVTFEFENVPIATLKMLDGIVPVRPNPDVLAVTRHRAREKEHIRAQAIQTAPFAVIASEPDIETAKKEIGAPAILKTCELGYDGKGQIVVKSVDELASAWEKLGKSECVLEGFIDFEFEASIIVARSLDGSMQCFPMVQNVHTNHILHKTIAPAPGAQRYETDATHIATTLAKSLDVVGLLAVELFVTKDGLLVNELAPRPHNSGHWTIEGCATNQFEQHIRAICGWKLAEPEMLHKAEMRNLLGDEWQEWEHYAEVPNAHIHLYGKTQSRPGRKMGHVTLLK